MSRAAVAVAQQVIETLQNQIQLWQAELQKIDIARARHDAKVARYQILSDLIAEAQAEIARKQARLESAVTASKVGEQA